MTDTAFMTFDPKDLDYFSAAEDLFDPAWTRSLNTRSIDQTITDSAHRALQICNAQAQLLLAQYQAETVEDMKAALAKAEAIAFALGQFDCDPERLRRNPFEDELLRAAWERGMQDARLSRTEHPMDRLHHKFWEEGIDTEDIRSQFELCALQLYRMAASFSNPEQAARARRLAMEMCRYHDGETPTPRRQQEIDRFMARQAERLALELEF